MSRIISPPVRLGALLFSEVVPETDILQNKGVPQTLQSLGTKKQFSGKMEMSHEEKNNNDHSTPCAMTKQATRTEIPNERITVALAKSTTQRSRFGVSTVWESST